MSAYQKHEWKNGSCIHCDVVAVDADPWCMARPMTDDTKDRAALVEQIITLLTDAPVPSGPAVTPRKRVEGLARKIAAPLAERKPDADLNTLLVSASNVLRRWMAWTVATDRKNLPEALLEDTDILLEAIHRQTSAPRPEPSEGAEARSIGRIVGWLDCCSGPLTEDGTRLHFEGCPAWCPQPTEPEGGA